MNILWAFIWFAIIGGVLGLLLAFAAKIFAVEVDERIEKIIEVLPGANCGGCGYAGCSGLAEAITNGTAKTNACTAGGDKSAKAISDIMGTDEISAVRMRAQVMCSGSSELAKKKYIYEGVNDCISASRLGGGDKLCPNGCIGLGSCVAQCKFEAIKIINGVAAVDYNKCVGCGTCVSACPKHIIKLIPFNSAHWVGCMSVDKGATTRKYCDVGCISCGICQKNCDSGAIKITDFVASIDYEKCTDCGKCVEKCPRMIIWSGKTQDRVGIVISKSDLDDKKIVS